jgi:hypothetical protein
MVNMKKDKNYNVYFEGSIAGKQTYGENYERIIKSLRDHGCDVNELIFQVTLEEARSRTREECKRIYSDILQKIRKSDIFVADMTYSSPSLAMLIQDAIYRFNKPVLMLVFDQKEGKRGVPFTGNTSKLLTMKEYSFSNLDKIIEDFLRKVKYKILSNRISIRLPAEIDEYLEYKKIETKEVSKNQTLLNLLEDLIENDSGFQRFVRDRWKE